MRVLNVAVVLSLSVLLVSSFTQAQRIADEPMSSAITLEIPAQTLAEHESTEIIVHLPMGYTSDAERTYPVVFFLHGWGSDAGSFERLGGVRALADLPDDNAMVVVSVSGETSSYMNWADGQSLWEDHLLGAVSDTVTSEFRVATRPQHRALYGVSMGGAAALRIAMSHPDKFACAAAHSAAISPIDFDEQPEWQKTGFLEMEDFADRYGDPFNPDLWKAQNPLHLALNSDPQDLRLVRYYFDVGVDDQLGFADDNAALSQSLSKQGVPHIFAIRNGRHGSAFVEANINQAMQFLSRCMSSDHQSRTSQ